MSATEAWTVGRLLSWTTDFLKKSGSTSPRLDAEVLLSEAKNCERIELYTAFAEEPTEEVRTAFRELVRRRAEGTPVAYLVGHKEFYSLPFDVNPDVLIPRPETEHLVVEALDRAKQLRASDPSRLLRVVDVGTGSGIIAICLAKHLANCQVVGLDCSQAALEVARRNAEKHAVDGLIQWVQSDLLKAVVDQPPFDLVLSNPPYISEAEFAKLPRSIREQEPKQALLGGPVGNEIIARLLVDAAQLTVPSGYLIFELSPMLAGSLEALIDHGVWGPQHVTKDFANLSRVVTLQRLSS